jgi:hypothetical protein
MIRPTGRDGLRAFLSYCLNGPRAYISYGRIINFYFYFVIFFSDNVPAICLGQWALNTELFDGDEQAGPVPTLFAEDKEGALEGLTRNVTRAHADIQKLARVFFMPEVVDLDEALSIIKKPRYDGFISVLR